MPRPDSSPVLIVVDLQRYYIDPESNFRKYPESKNPQAFNYIETRCNDIVIPNVVRLVDHFRANDWSIVFLRLCGQNPDRSDLHHTFHKANQEGDANGFPGRYPLSDEPLASIIPEIVPLSSEPVLDKVTYSGFTSTDLEDELLRLQAGELVFCGLATSQCVDTTARDASDRGYDIIHVEDAQADYSEMSHQASLYASQGVCGGMVFSTDEVIAEIRPSDLFPL